MTLPTWAPDPGFLLNVPSDDGTLDSLADVDPGLAVGTYGSLASALLAWNSAVFLPSAGSLGAYVMILGGHSDYAGNAWFLFDVSTRQWSVLSTNSSGLTSAANPTAWADSKGRYADGKVGSPHTYGNIVAVPATIAYPQGRAMLVGTSYAGFTGGVTNWYAHAIDAATGAQQASASPAGLSGEPNCSACYDPVRDVIWAFGSQSGTSECAQLDPYALTWGSVQYITETGSPYWRQYVLSCYHPASDLIVQRVAYGGTNGIFLFDPDTVARVQATTSGTGPSSTEGAGFEYCDLDGCFYAYVPGQTKVFKLTPPASSWWTGTWVWSTENFDAGSDAPAYATYAGTEINRMQRWRWVPDAECFFWLDTVSQQPQVYRPLASTGSGGGGSTTTGPALLAYPNLVVGATVSGGDWGTTLGNILTRDLGEVAESASLDVADTQFILDLQSERYVRMVAIIGHTMTAAGVVEISLGTTSGGDEAGASGLVDAWQMAFDDRLRRMPAADAWVGSPFAIIYVHPTEVACRYIKIAMSDAGNPAGVLRVGRAFVAPAIELDMDIGASIDWVDPTPVDRTLGGRLLYQSRRPYRVAEIPVSYIDATARGQIMEARRGAGAHDEVGFVPDSLDAAAQQEFGFVGRWRDLGQMPWSLPLRFSTTLSLEELL